MKAMKLPCFYLLSDGFRIGDRESLDNSGTPVRFVSRDAMQNKYNSINQDNDRNN